MEKSGQFLVWNPWIKSIHVLAAMGNAWKEELQKLSGQEERNLNVVIPV